MKPLIFNFTELNENDKPVKKAAQLFQRAGANVVQTDAGASVKRTAGVSYRELSMTFADSQVAVFRIKQTGDIFQVLLNGAILPIKAQDDHSAAIAEVAKAMDSGRSKFQKKLAAIKVKPPAGIRTAAPKLEQVLTARRDNLKESIAAVKAETERLRAAA